MYEVFSEFLKGKGKICVVQAENPDGDSLGSAIALDYLLPDKEITLYCPIERHYHFTQMWHKSTQKSDINYTLL